MTWTVGGASLLAHCPRCGTELPTVVADPDYDDGNDPANADYVIDRDAGHEVNSSKFLEFLQFSECGSTPRRAPVPSARVAVVDGESVLLVEMGFGDAEGAWVLPGGHVEAGESLPAAAVGNCVRRPASASIPTRSNPSEPVPSGTTPARWVSV